MPRIELVLGDITRQQVDAVVNAANSSLLGGGGVDGAIHEAAGPELQAACRALRAGEYVHGLPAGQAVATTAGDLPAQWVIHTVGPVFEPGEDRSDVLASCFRESLRLADELGARSVAFPAVSAGVYRWPIDEVARIAIGTVLSTPTKVDQVSFVLFAEPALEAFQGALARAQIDLTELGRGARLRPADRLSRPPGIGGARRGLSASGSKSVLEAHPGRCSRGRSPVPVPRRVAMLSVHTSPLDQPGTGDAGGMNVYVVELARAAGRARHRGRDLHPGHPQRPAAQRRAGPRRHWCGTSSPARSRAWPRRTCPASCARSPRGVLRAEASHEPGLLRPRALALLAVRPGRLARRRALGRAARAHHAHHGQGQERRARRGRRARADRAGHRRGAGRRAGRPAGRQHRRRGRPAGRPLRRRPGQGRRRSPPASTSTCSARAGRRRGQARAALGLPPDAVVLLFVGRIQPLKAPDVLLRAAAALVGDDPALRDRLVVAVVGGPSGTGPGAPDPPGRAGRRRSGIARPRPVRAAGRPGRRSPTGTGPPTWPSCRRTTSRSGWSRSRRRRAGRRWSRPRSAGCATAVADGRSGLLVDGHDPGDWAVRDRRPARLAPAARRAARAGAVRHAGRLRLADAPPRRCIDVYEGAVLDHRRRLLDRSPVGSS